MLDAVSQMPDEEIKSKDFDTLIKSAASLAKAIAYKRKLDIESKDILENGADQFKTLIFDAMAAERPELYEQVRKFVKEKENKL